MPTCSANDSESGFSQQQTHGNSRPTTEPKAITNPLHFPFRFLSPESLNLEGRQGIADVRTEDFELIGTPGEHPDGAFCIEMVPQQVL